MLNIRNPRATVLAKRLAQARGTTMTEAVVTALEQALRRVRDAAPLAARLKTLAQKARSMAGPHGRDMTRDEIDALSGQ